ncbi:MAG: hypothetical protein ABIP17_02445 [Ilumatobacteraceae bacterium]
MTSTSGSEISTEIDLGCVDLDDLCFTARALAQTHPMSGPALRYRQECLDRERERQHVTELADWASTALLVGYCLRRSEEHAAGRLLQPFEADSETFSVGASELSETLRTGDADSVTLLPPDLAIAAIDRIIGTEIHKRNEHLREQLDDAAWAEFEGYIAWWVVHGYCVRVVETR